MDVVAEQVRGRVAALNEALAAIPGLGAFRLDVVDPKALENAPKNARFMTNEQFTRLVKNVKADGALSSVPLCWKKPDGAMRVLSGNHRVKAAVEAGLPHVVVMYLEGELPRAREVAIQLSHNAIVRQDDPALLRELWAEISELPEKMYSGLDDRSLKELGDPALPSLSEVRLDYRSVTMLFLPEEVERLEATFRAAMETVAAKDVLTGPLSAWSPLMDAMAKVMDAHDVRNTACAFMLLMRLFDRHQRDLAEGYDAGETTKHASTVPLSSVLGTDRVPPELARRLNRLLDSLVGKGEVPTDARWKVLERLLGDGVREG